MSLVPPLVLLPQLAQLANYQAALAFPVQQLALVLVQAHRLPAPVFACDQQSADSKVVQAQQQR